MCGSDYENISVLICSVVGNCLSSNENHVRTERNGREMPVINDYWSLSERKADGN